MCEVTLRIKKQTNPPPPKPKPHSFVHISSYILRCTRVPFTNFPLEISYKSHPYSLSLVKSWKAGLYLSTKGYRKHYLLTLKNLISLQIISSHLLWVRNAFTDILVFVTACHRPVSPHARAHCGDRTNQHSHFSLSYSSKVRVLERKQDKQCLV